MERSAERAVGELAEAVARGLGGEPSLSRRAALLWTRLAGPTLAEHVRVAGIRDATVHLVADGPAWAAQARYRSGELLAALAPQAGELGGRLVARVTVQPPARRTDPERSGGRDGRPGGEPLTGGRGW